MKRPARRRSWRVKPGALDNAFVLIGIARSQRPAVSVERTLEVVLDPGR